MADTSSTNLTNKALLYILKKLKQMERKQDVIRENINEILDFLNEIKEEDT